MRFRSIACCMLLATSFACERRPRSFSFEVVQRYGIAEPTADSITQAPHVRQAGGAVLGQVTGAVQTADSSVYVLDRHWRKIVAFSRHGTLRDVLLGGDGEGPGEFRNPIHLGLLPSGELAVLDYSLGRLSYFHPMTGFVGSAHVDVHNTLRLFPLQDRIWVTTNTLLPGERGARAIAVDRDGRRVAEAPPPVDAEIPFGGFPVLAVSPDSMLILPHNRPGLWDVFDGKVTRTRGQELLPELTPPVVVREGMNISTGSAMLGNKRVGPIAVAALRSGQVIFCYWTMENGDDERPLPDTRVAITEVFSSNGRHLGRAALPEGIGVPYFVHVSPFTDHMLVTVTDPYPHVLELRLVESKEGP